MAGKVEGKVFVVTGAGGAIGREIALALAREGGRIVVNDLGSSVSGEGSDATPAQQTANEIAALGAEAVVNTDSVSTWASAERIIQCALDHFGRIDGVINNAGILRDRMFHRMSEEEWLDVIGVHLNGCFFVARHAAQHFREQKSGTYVHMTSTSGLYGNIGQVNYGAAKLGITGLSKIIALEMASSGVRSNCIAPAAWSRMIGSIPDDTPEQKARIERVRTKLAAHTVAPIAVALSCDDSAGISGQVFYVRGNEIMLFRQFEVVRSVHRSEGWTPQSIAEHALPALKASLHPLKQAREMTTWEPI
jgi:NAD(P)-dependent dehydrogenase (short-subunit alcohol dehydrogenase family)